MDGITQKAAEHEARREQEQLRSLLTDKLIELAQIESDYDEDKACDVFDFNPHQEKLVTIIGMSELNKLKLDLYTVLVGEDQARRRANIGELDLESLKRRQNEVAVKKVLSAFLEKDPARTLSLLQATKEIKQDEERELQQAEQAKRTAALLQAAQTAERAKLDADRKAKEAQIKLEQSGVKAGQADDKKVQEVLSETRLIVQQLKSQPPEPITDFMTEIETS